MLAIAIILVHSLSLWCWTAAWLTEIDLLLNMSPLEQNPMNCDVMRGDIHNYYHACNVAIAL